MAFKIDFTCPKCGLSTYAKFMNKPTPSQHKMRCPKCKQSYKGVLVDWPGRAAENTEES